MSIDVVTIVDWARFPWLAHGFTTRRGGHSQAYGVDELNLGLTREDDPAAVKANRAALIEALAPGCRLLAARQVHSTQVYVLPDLESLDDVQSLEADGLVTAVPGVLLAALAADCVPVLLADTRLRLVAAVHAGWRGTVAGIVGVASDAFGQLGSRPEDRIAAIGPSIGACCYQVGGEVEQRFQDSFPYADELFTRTGGELSLDLWEANRRQLSAAGMAPSQISLVGECTACTTSAGGRKYFSHRADAGRTGRSMGVIGIRPDAAS